MTQYSMDDLGYVAYYFFCAGGMFLLVQGIALFCGGLTSPKAALSQCSFSLMSSTVTLLQYFVVGYSLNTSAPDDPHSAFSWLVGDFKRAFWRHVVRSAPDPAYDPLPELGQVMLSYGLATVSSALVASSATQRARIIPLLLFLAAWLTVVYCPIAYWCWNPMGWSYRFGALDYAGGTAIHCTAGFTALLYSLVLGPRLGYGTLTSPSDQPFSLPLVVLGTSLMWFGWIGFNGGASLKPSLEALWAVVNTQISASAGGLTWMILDHAFSGQWSIVSFCSGIVAGLVSVTPGAGYVPFWSALIFGIVGGVCCNLGTNVKFRLSVDDPLDVFAVHGIGGFVGSILTGVFASPDAAPERSVGLLYGGWAQPLRQFLSALAIAAYTLAAGLVVLLAIDSMPGLHLRVSAEQEALGIDLTEYGESALTSERHAPHHAEPVGVVMNPRLRQTHVNTSMNPQFVDWPLLQKIPASYGTLENGSQGVAGPSGPSGPPGPQGPAGLPGMSGFSGLGPR